MAAFAGQVGHLVLTGAKFNFNSLDQVRIEGLHSPFLRGHHPISICTRANDSRAKVSSVHGRKQFPQRMATRSAATVSAGSQSPLVKEVDFKKLQNGSDIRGVAVAGVEGEPVNLTEPVTEAIAAGFATWLLDRKKGDGTKKLKVAVGHDSRISADSLQSAVARGIVAEGLGVVLYGLASTPAMFNSTLTEDDELLVPVDGAIMITASHLPYNRNGLKFFTNTGGLGKVDISDILSRASKIYDLMKDGSRIVGSKPEAGKVNYMDRYAEDLAAAIRKGGRGIDKPLSYFHIVVDAGNGAGGFFAGKVLDPLGANTTGSQFLEPDGMFPNHVPNPEDKKAMEAITKAVLNNKADLGIIFDTDVDRSAAVLATGCQLNRNRLIALMSAIVLREHPGTTIVTDSVTSDGLTTFIEKLGGKHHRFKRGYKNVIDEGIRLNQIGVETHLAIETSGHGALKENNWLDDGAYLMVKILIKLAAKAVIGELDGSVSETLASMIEGLEEAEFEAELRFKIDQNHQELGKGTFQDYGEQVLKKLDSMVESNPDLQKASVNYEGVRVSGFGGWFLLRLSLHDPVLPLNIEAPSKEAAQKLGTAVLTAVQGFNALDISPLIQYIKSLNN